MAQFYGKNSSYLIKGDLKNYGYTVGLVFLVLIIFSLIYKFFIVAVPLVGIACVFILVKVMEPIIKHFRRKSDKFYRGFGGELEIKRVLQNLPDGFAVFQDLNFPGQRGNIDFAVAGPTGMFTIEVKSHRGAVGYNGQEITLNGRMFPEKNILRQAFGEAIKLKSFIKQSTRQDIYVKPVLVFSRGYGLRFGLRPLDNVYVIGKDFLLELITSHPSYHYPLSQDQLTAALKTLVTS